MLSYLSSLLFRLECAAVEPALADIHRLVSALFTSEVKVLHFKTQTIIPSVVQN